MKRKKWCRIGDVAEATGLSESVISRIADLGRIPCLRLDSRGNRYFNLEDVVNSLGLEKETIGAVKNIETPGQNKAQGVIYECGKN